MLVCFHHAHRIFLPVSFQCRLFFFTMFYCPHVGGITSINISAHFKVPNTASHTNVWTHKKAGLIRRVRTFHLCPTKIHALPWHRQTHIYFPFLALGQLQWSLHRLSCSFTPVKESPYQCSKFSLLTFSFLWAKIFSQLNNNISGQAHFTHAINKHHRQKRNETHGSSKSFSSCSRR